MKKASSRTSGRRRKRAIYLADLLRPDGWVRFTLRSPEPIATTDLLGLALLDREEVTEATTDRAWIEEIARSYAGRWIIWPAELRSLESQISSSIHVGHDLAFPDGPASEDLDWLRETVATAALAAINADQVPKRLSRVAVLGPGGEVARLDLAPADVIGAALNAKLLIKPAKTHAAKKAPAKRRKPGGWSKLYRRVAAKKGG